MEMSKLYILQAVFILASSTHISRTETKRYIHKENKDCEYKIKENESYYAAFKEQEKIEKENNDRVYRINENESYRYYESFNEEENPGKTRNHFKDENVSKTNHAKFADVMKVIGEYLRHMKNVRPQNNSNENLLLNDDEFLDVVRDRSLIISKENIYILLNGKLFAGPDAAGSLQEQTDIRLDSKLDASERMENLELDKHAGNNVPSARSGYGHHGYQCGHSPMSIFNLLTFLVYGFSLFVTLMSSTLLGTLLNNILNANINTNMNTNENMNMNTNENMNMNGRDLKDLLSMESFSGDSQTNLRFKSAERDFSGNSKIHPRTRSAARNIIGESQIQPRFKTSERDFNNDLRTQANSKRAIWDHEVENNYQNLSQNFATHLQILMDKISDDFSDTKHIKEHPQIRKYLQNLTDKMSGNFSYRRDIMKKQYITKEFQEKVENTLGPGMLVSLLHLSEANQHLSSNCAKNIIASKFISF